MTSCIEPSDEGETEKCELKCVSTFSGSPTINSTCIIIIIIIITTTTTTTISTIVDVEGYSII